MPRRQRESFAIVVLENVSIQSQRNGWQKEIIIVQMPFSCTANLDPDLFRLLHSTSKISEQTESSAYCVFSPPRMICEATVATIFAQ